MNTYIIGIDTGGTYTDAALLDADTGQVLASSKAPTIHHHLAIGSSQAAQAAETSDP